MPLRSGRGLCAARSVLLRSQGPGSQGPRVHGPACLVALHAHFHLLPWGVPTGTMCMMRREWGALMLARAGCRLHFYLWKVQECSGCVLPELHRRGTGTEKERRGMRTADKGARAEKED